MDRGFTLPPSWAPSRRRGPDWSQRPALWLPAPVLVSCLEPEPQQERHVERSSALSAGRSSTEACWCLCAVWGGAHLSDRLFVPHRRLLDEAVDFNIPISARNDHSGLPETHRHFHRSAAAAVAFNSSEEKDASEPQQPFPACPRKKNKKYLKNPQL